VLSRSVLVLAACGGLALVAAAGCSSATDDGSSGAQSSDITTTDVISRAQQWVNAKLLYCQSPNHAHDYDTACSSTCNREDNPDWDPYRSDCSGFVSWAWGLPPPGRVTWQFAPADTSVSHVIQATDLQPGDACNIASEHIILFVKWITKNTQAQFYEEPGCSSSTPYAHSFTSNVSVSGSSIYVAYEGRSFTAIRFDQIEPPNAAPKGYLDSASCDTIDGWSQDPDSPKAAVTVHLTFDAPTGKAGSGSMKRLADGYRADLCKALGTCTHAYSVPTPLGLRDGAKHSVYAYGEDAQDSSLHLLTNAPKSFTCQPPAIPQGIKRHVVDPTSMKAWKFDGLLDVAHEPLAGVQAVPDGPDLPAAPLAVISDDGAPEVWVIDVAKDGTQVRRHVINPTSLSAWQLTVTTWTAAKVNAVPQGPDWPAAPFVMQGNGAPEVYVMDETPPPPPGSSGSGNGGNGGPGGNADAGGSGGCNQSGGAGDAWLLALAMLALHRRRSR
jgi:hypothetical protein